ncbi:hypothetical protein [Polaromonas sp. CG9_12]|nr:hypothetical protein [Polaromonas sp. CG9_12]
MSNFLRNMAGQAGGSAPPEWVRRQGRPKNLDRQVIRNSPRTSL